MCVCVCVSSSFIFSCIIFVVSFSCLSGVRVCVSVCAVCLIHLCVLSLRILFVRLGIGIGAVVR